MPKFTITRNGQTVKMLTLDGERIEMGSSQICPVFIDDLLISLKQAAFVKRPEGYWVEPMARIPVFFLNGKQVDGPIRLESGAEIDVEGYKIRVDFERAAPDHLQPDVGVAVPLEPPTVTAESVPPPLEPPPLSSIPQAHPPSGVARTSGSGPSPAPLSTTRPPDTLPPPLSELGIATAPPLKTAASAGGAKSDDEQKTVFVVPAKSIGELVAVAGPLKGKKWPLFPGEIKIGRNKEQNDIAIYLDPSGAPDKSISRRHASIHVEKGAAYVEDHGSVAGTFVNQRQLTPKQRTLLKSGDQLEIRSAKESTVFRLELDMAATGPPRPMPTSMERGALTLEPSLPPPLDTLQPKPAPLRESHPIVTPDFAPTREPARQAEPPAEPERRRPRERARGASDDNFFLPVEEPSGWQRIPMWGWVGGGMAVVIITVLLLLVCR